MACVVEMQVISGPQLHHRSKLVLPHFHASGSSYNYPCALALCVCTLVTEKENVWYHNTDTTFALSCALCSTSCSLTDLTDMSTYISEICLCHKKFKLSSGIMISTQCVFGTLYKFTYKKSKYHGKVMASNYNIMVLWYGLQNEIIIILKCSFFSYFLVLVCSILGLPKLNGNFFFFLILTEFFKNTMVVPWSMFKKTMVVP